MDPVMHTRLVCVKLTRSNFRCSESSSLLASHRQPHICTFSNDRGGMCWEQHAEHHQRINRSSNIPTGAESFQIQAMPE